MRMSLSQLIQHALLMAAILLCPTCAAHGRPPDPRLELSVVVEPCVHVELSASLLDLDGNLHVHGSVRPKGMRSSVPGHVDVVVRSADGTQWAMKQANYVQRARTGVRGQPPHLESAFATTFDGQPPVGSTVTLRHHDAPHGER